MEELRKDVRISIGKLFLTKTLAIVSEHLQNLICSWRKHLTGRYPEKQKKTSNPNEKNVLTAKHCPFFRNRSRNLKHPTTTRSNVKNRKWEITKTWIMLNSQDVKARKTPKLIINQLKLLRPIWVDSGWSSFNFSVNTYIKRATMILSLPQISFFLFCFVYTLCQWCNDACKIPDS